jgi:hypothetical protein
MWLRYKPYVTRGCGPRGVGTEHEARISEAIPVFDDRYTLYDRGWGTDAAERRFVTLGIGAAGRLLRSCKMAERSGGATSYQTLIDRGTEVERRLIQSQIGRALIRNGLVTRLLPRPLAAPGSPFRRSVIRGIQKSFG